MATIPEVLLAHYNNHPQREAIVFAHSDGKRTYITFEDIYLNANALAKSFLSLGVKKSDFILISLKNCAEWFYAVFGAIIAGARPVSKGFTYTDGSDVIGLVKALNMCTTVVLDPYSDKETWDIFKKLIDGFDGNGNLKSTLMPSLKFLICRQKPEEDQAGLTIGDMLKWENEDVSLPRIEPGDDAILIQSGGSTGAPKAIVHTNRSLIACINQFVDSYWSRDIRFFSDRTFAWMAGFPTNIISGETRVTKFGYDEPPSDYIGFLIDTIKREKCTHLLALPPLINQFLERQDDIGDDWPVELIRCGGQPISRWVVQCIGKLCRRFLAVYAAAEMFITCGLEVDSPELYEEFSVGHAVRGAQIKIVDENGEGVPAKQRGRILVKSDGLFREYFNDPEKTKARFTADGWFDTDDIGFMTEEGSLICLGRGSDVIITGTLTVPAAILEAFIQKYPGVSSVVCVPVPDDVEYQLICACVILKPGCDVTEDQLRHYCDDMHTDKIRYFTAVPNYYLFLDEFPLMKTRKVSRAELTQMAIEKFKRQ